MARLRILPGRERDVTPGAAALPPVTGSPPRHGPDLSQDVPYVRPSNRIRLANGLPVSGLIEGGEWLSLAWPGMTKRGSSAEDAGSPRGQWIGKHRRPRKSAGARAAPVARPTTAAFGAANERFAAQLTVIIPAYNEAASLADTVKSLVNQTTPPARVVVVDDCSTDGTGEVAAALGVEVLRPPANTGSKAGAQTFALRTVATRYVMAIDADTILATDAIGELSAAFADPGVAAACGLVLPRHVGTVWERGRYVEYLYSFTFHKQVQDAYGRPR